MTILLNQFILNSHNIEHGFFQVLILSLAVGTICSFLLVALKDPGIITKDRIPLPADEKQLESMPYCDICSIFQPPRVAHCTTCDCCIVGLDHHCPWVGKCIGKGNMFFFKLFNFFWVSYFFLFIWIMAKSWYCCIIDKTADNKHRGWWYSRIIQIIINHYIITIRWMPLFYFIQCT